MYRQFQQEYVSLIIGLNKNNGSVLHDDNFFLFIHRLYTAKHLHHGIWQHVTFTLLPCSTSFYHGQILIETETDSLYIKHFTII